MVQPQNTDPRSPDPQKSSEKNAGQKFDINVPRKYGTDQQDENVDERTGGQPAEWQTPGNDTFPGVENTPNPPPPAQGKENPERRWL